MNAYRNLTKPIVAILALLMAFSAVAVLAVDDSDAIGINTSGITDKNFKEDKNGTLVIPVLNGFGHTCKVLIEEDGKTVTVQDFANVEDVIEISVELSKGPHHLNIIITDLDNSTSCPSSYTLEVKENVWSRVGTYLAVVVVVIVVIIILVVYMRARPNNKPTTTFTQLEEEKKAATSAKEQPVAPAKTEKVKYTSSRRK
ncbi:MAG: hypothetical protein MJZ21_02775 [archaeon]|nr:hypothetical protein [archaeon]